MSNYVGKPVVLLGKVEETNSGGKVVKLTTTDNVQVNVTLPTPLEENVGRYIEVQGTLQSKSTMSCTSFIVISEAVVEEFDAEVYDATIKLYHLFGKDIWTMCKFEN